MIPDGTYSLGENYALVLHAGQRYVTASLTNRPHDTNTELVRKEARSRWQVALTLGPWREVGINAWKAIAVTCISARRG